MSLIERLERGVDTNQPPDATDRVMSEAATEIARLQRERDQIELDLIHMAERNEKLRAALEAARRHIGNGYQPPELMDQIERALAK